MKKVMLLLGLCFVVFCLSSQRNLGSFKDNDEGTEPPCKKLNDGTPYVTLEGSLLDTDLIDNEIHLLLKDCYSGEIIAQTGNINQYIINQEEVRCGHNEWKTLFNYRIRITFYDICDNYADQEICVEPCIYILEDGYLIPLYEFSDQTTLTTCKYIRYDGNLGGCSDSFYLCCPDFNTLDIDKSLQKGDSLGFEDTTDDFQFLSVDLISNPIKDKIILRINSNYSENVDLHLMLYDVSGNNLFNSTLNQKSELIQIDIPFLPSGIYILIVSDGNNKVFKVVIKD